MNDNVGPIQPCSSMSGLSLYVARYFLEPPNQKEEGIVRNKETLVNGTFKTTDIFLQHVM